jgi:hypothetical protein
MANLKKYVTFGARLTNRPEKEQRAFSQYDERKTHH